MTKKNWITLIVMLFFIKSAAQQSNTLIPIHFKLKFNENEVIKDQNFVSAKGDTLSIENFKCYISNVKLEYTDNTISAEKNSYHLLDLDSINSFKFNLPKQGNKQITKITFNIGIDSTTSTSGLHSGALDPMNGMYWAWQSGYINFKIEGKSSSCKTRHNKFHFHVGGYLYPHYAMREIKIKGSFNKEINLAIDLAQFFKEINLETENALMIPGKKAMELADLSLHLFSIE